MKFVDELTKMKLNWNKCKDQYVPTFIIRKRLLGEYRGLHELFPILSDLRRYV